MAGRAYIGNRNIKVRPNSFYVESPVSLGCTVDPQHRDFSKQNDLIYKFESGIKVPQVTLSGNVNSKVNIEQGDYILRGGFLRTFVSGVNVEEGRGKPAMLEVYSMTSPYPISEGGMTYARNRLDGVATANGTTALVGTSTNWDHDQTSGGNGNRGGVTTGSTIIINGTEYTVVTITDDTNMTVDATVSAGTYEIEMDTTVGDKEYVGVMAYEDAGHVCWEENFDGEDAELSRTTTITRVGANSVVRKGSPYILAAERDAWAAYVRDTNADALKSYQINQAIGGSARVPVSTFEDKNFYKNKGMLFENTDETAGTGSFYRPGVFNKGTPGMDVNLTARANYTGRIYLTLGRYDSNKRFSLSAPRGNYWRFVALDGTAMDIGLSETYLPQGIIKYETDQTFDVDPNNTVVTSTNNTKINKVYSTENLWNPFVATDEVPIVQSFVDLSSDVVKSGANALHMYHIWGESPDNPDIQKYLGRDNGLNAQTSYVSIYNIPQPIVQDISQTANIGDHRNIFPYISLDMNIQKLQPCVTFDTNSVAGKAAFGGSGAIYSASNYPSYTAFGSSFGSTDQQKEQETFLRSVVITFSNYKPTDDMQSLDDFLDYGLDNFYAGSGSGDDYSGRIVGGVCLMKYGMNPASDIDAGFVYAQALPVMAQEDGTGMWTSKGGLARVVSGSGAGQLKQLIMRPTTLTNAAGTPRTVKVPMSEWFNMKFYIDVQAKNGENSASRNPYGDGKGAIGGESSGVGMRCYFGMESDQGDAPITSDSGPDKDIPYVDIPFPYSPTAHNSQGAGTGDDGYTLSDLYYYERTLMPQYMTVWVQNYRFVENTEVFFNYGDNQIIDSSTNGAATEAEVFIDNISMVDFYQSFTNVSSKHSSYGNISFPQGRMVYNPTKQIEPNSSSSAIKMTSFNPGTGSTEFTDMAANYYKKTTASYFNIGLENANDLPISGSATSRRGYFLMNGFYSSDQQRLNRLVPDLWSGSMLSQSWSAVTTNNNKYLGYACVGASYASGTYNDPATGSTMYDVTGGQDVTSKINITTGSNNYMACDGFTQKGAFMASISGTQFTNWFKRENVFASTKVTAIATVENAKSNNQIQIADTSILTENDPNTQYIIYVLGSDTQVAGDNRRKVVKLASGKDSIAPDGWITLDDDVNTTSAGGGSARALCCEGNLNRLYISPYKYWITLLTKGHSDFAHRNYDSVCLLGNNLSGATVSNITGTTFNEVEYTYDVTATGTVGGSAPYFHEWAFDMDPDEETIIQLNADYGYGAWDPDKQKGGAVSRRIVQKNTYANLDISSLLLSAEVGEDGEYGLVLKMPQDSLGTTQIQLYGDEYAGTNSRQYKPTYIYEYQDVLPLLGNLNVTPAFNLLDKGVNPYTLTDANLNALKFSWEEDGGDVWYRMLMTNDNAAVPNKYTNAKLWIPMNEEPPNLTTKAAMIAYNMTNNTSGAATVGDSVLSYIDGISGYSPEVDAQTSNVSGTISVPNGTNDVFHNLSEYTLVTHVTFDSTMAGAACDILKQSGSASELISLHKNTSNQIVFTHDTSSATAVTGSEFIVCDGKTAYSIIATYKYQSEAGPDIQLFIDGNRSGYASDASEALDASSSVFTIAPSGASNKFKGRIEEVIVYNKKYEVPSNAAQYIMSTADLADNDSNKSINWSARLFNFDYHNIRGKTLNDVARSNEVNWGATTL